jgi:hypothetical protein
LLANNRFFGTSAATAVSGLAPAPNGLLAHQMLARQSGGWGKTVAVPRGYGSIGLAWPARAGEIGADLDATIKLSATGTMLATRAVAGSTSVTLTAVGELAAVAAVAGSAAITLTATGAVAGLAAVEGSAGLSLTASGTLGATAAVAGQAEIVLTCSSTMGARAAVAGTAYFSAAAEGSQLTEASIAAAVLAAVGGALVLADVRYVNGIEVTGTGTSGDPWGPT